MNDKFGFRQTVGIVLKLSLTNRPNRRVFRIVIEPVVVDICSLLRHAANNNRSLNTSEHIVMNFEPGACDIGIVLSVAAAVHIKAMAQRILNLHIMSCFVAATRPTRSRNRVAVVVEQIVLNQRKRLVMAYAVTQPVVLIVVDEVVMDVMLVAGT